MGCVDGFIISIGFYEFRVGNGETDDELYQIPPNKKFGLLPAVWILLVRQLQRNPLHHREAELRSIERSIARLPIKLDEQPYWLRLRWVRPLQTRPSPLLRTPSS